MALRDIKPTRSELINLKRKIQLSERGYKILKMKRDGLILEFFRILSEAKDSRGELLKKYKLAVDMMAVANTVEGAIGVKAAAFSVKEVPQITLKSKNIMGVVVPDIESSKVKKTLTDRGYGVLGTSPVIDETASEFKDIPELTAARDFIKMRLDEMEREELFRMKKIKARGSA